MFVVSVPIETLSGVEVQADNAMEVWLAIGSTQVEQPDHPQRECRCQDTVYGVKVFQCRGWSLGTTKRDREKRQTPYSIRRGKVTDGAFQLPRLATVLRLDWILELEEPVVLALFQEVIVNTVIQRILRGCNINRQEIIEFRSNVIGRTEHSSRRPAWSAQNSSALARSSWGWCVSGL